MTFPGFRHLLGVLLALSGTGPSSAEDAAVCGGKPVSVRIVEVPDGASFKLEDGRAVRLASVIPPIPIDGDPQAIIRAKEALTQIASGKTASLFLANESKDRYGRLVAQAVDQEGKTWLEAELLARGAVRVLPSANDECMKALLQFEAKARATRTGFWNDPQFGVFDAQHTDALLAAAGRFAVVEGVIRRVGESRGRVYLDFGRRFTEDFTIVVPDTVRKSLLAQGSDPKSWRGRRIRVRGIVFSWGGPAIEASIVQAIELLE